MPFNADDILKQRTNELASASSDASRLLTLPSHACLRLADRSFAIPLGELLGAEEQKVTPVPLSGAGWLGVTHYQEEIWPVRWLSDPHPVFRSEVYVAFLRQYRVGLAVDQNCGLLTLPERPGARALATLPGLDFLHIVGYTEDSIAIVELEPR